MTPSKSVRTVISTRADPALLQGTDAGVAGEHPNFESRLRPGKSYSAVGHWAVAPLASSRADEYEFHVDLEWGVLLNITGRLPRRRIRVYEVIEVTSTKALEPQPLHL